MGLSSTESFLGHAYEHTATGRAGHARKATGDLYEIHTNSSLSSSRSSAWKTLKYWFYIISAMQKLKVKIKFMQVKTKWRKTNMAGKRSNFTLELLNATLEIHEIHLNYLSENMKTTFVQFSCPCYQRKVDNFGERTLLSEQCVEGTEISQSLV